MLCKYADDTYIIIPASNVDSRPAELDNVTAWSRANNLTLKFEPIQVSRDCVYWQRVDRRSARRLSSRISSVSHRWRSYESRSLTDSQCLNMCKLQSTHVHHCSMHWECFVHMECPKLHFRRSTRQLSWLSFSMPLVPGGDSRLHQTDRGLKPSLVVPRDADSVMLIDRQLHS